MRQSGKYEVRLERAARVNVEVLGGPPKGEAASVRLFMKDEKDARYSLLVAKTYVNYKALFEFEDLPSGEYSIRVEIGAQSSKKRVLCETLKEVRPGDDLQVTLEPEVLPDAVFAELSGVLSVPPAWECGEIFVFAELNDAGLNGSRSHLVLSQDELTPIDRLAGSYRFDFGHVQTGAYTVGVGDTKRKMVIDKSIDVALGPEGASDLRLTVAAPVSVQVVVLDGAIGKPFEGRLSWKAGALMSGGFFQDASRVEEMEPFEFRAPKGSITLMCWEAGFVPLHEIVTVDDGLNTFTYTLEKVISVRIVLHAGDSPVAVSEAWQPVVRHSMGPASGYYMGVSNEGGARIGSVTQPGRYVLEGFSIEGYEPTEPLEFVAVRGEMTEVVIQLKAK